jgi:hypothetical protein
MKDHALLNHSKSSETPSHLPEPALNPCELDIHDFDSGIVITTSRVAFSEQQIAKIYEDTDEPPISRENPVNDTLRTGGKYLNLPIIENNQRVITELDELPDPIPDGITSENEIQGKTMLDSKKGKSLFLRLLVKLGIVKKEPLG